MNIPNLHLISTRCELRHTLHLEIPAPFQNGLVIHAAVELNQFGDGRFRFDLWGEMPRFLDTVPPSRAKLASADIAAPNISPSVGHDAFMKSLVSTISRTPEFQKGVADLLDLHFAANDTEGV